VPYRQFLPNIRGLILKKMLEMIRNIILLIGWPVLIGGSIFLVVKGNETYKYVKGSLVGKISRVLVITTLYVRCIVWGLWPHFLCLRTWITPMWGFQFSQFGL